MANYSTFSILPVAAILIHLLIAAFSTCAHGHSPHDVVTSVALSPNYADDRTLFIYVFDELKRSIDGGHTWKNLENGLDNNSGGLFSDIATTPGGTKCYKVFAASRGDGIYRSSDCGESWKPINIGLENLDVRRLVLSPDFGSDQTLVAIPQGTGLFVSNTAGDFWQHVAKGKFTATAVTFVKEQQSTRLLAGTESGDLHLSGNQFTSWFTQGEITGAGRITTLSLQTVVHDRKVIFIGTELNGLYKTYDLGKSFEHMPALPIPDNKKNAAHITSATAIENTRGSADIFVTMWHQAALFSPDGGNSWKHLASGIKKSPQADMDRFQTSHFYEIAVSPRVTKDGNAFIAGFAGLFKTVDGGNSWLEMETRPARDITGMAISPSFSSDGMIALATYDGGAYVTRNSGKTWIAHNVGLPSTHLWDISIIRHDKDPMAMFALSNEGILKSRGAFQSWALNRLATSKYWKHVTANFEADSIFARVAWRFLGRPKLSFPTQIAGSANLRSSNTLYLGTRYKGVLKSSDGGSTWVHPWTADDGWVPSVQMSPNYDVDTTVLASVRYNGIFRSTDCGNSWQKINAGLSPLAVSYSGLGTWAIAISPEFAKDRRIYYGTADGLYSIGAQGKTWERIKVSEHQQRELIRAIGVSPNFSSDDTIFVSVKGRGLYKSTDRGESFSAIATSLIRNHEVMKLFRFSPDYSNDHTIFAASAEEVFISDDSGDSWKKLERPIRYEDTKDNITYYGEWIRERNDAYSGGTIHRSNDPDARALFHFAGKEVTWYGPMSDKYGVANVFLDGELMDTIQQYSSEPTNFAPIITIRDIPSGAHTLAIEITGAADKESATGFIAIDALEAF